MVPVMPSGSHAAGSLLRSVISLRIVIVSGLHLRSEHGSGTVRLRDVVGQSLLSDVCRAVWRPDRG